MDYKKLMASQSKELARVLSRLDDFHGQIDKLVVKMKECFESGGKILVAGNGGSAAEAQHLAEELVARFKTDRRAYPAISLTADGTALTCIGNDFGFENIFKRQVEALGASGDIFIGLTTSGSSENIIRAANEASSQGMTVVALAGLEGKFNELADIALEVPSKTGARIQEIHLHAIHLICEAFEPENV